MGARFLQRTNIHQRHTYKWLSRTKLKASSLRKSCIQPFPSEAAVLFRPPEHAFNSTMVMAKAADWCRRLHSVSRKWGAAFCPIVDLAFQSCHIDLSKVDALQITRPPFELWMRVRSQFVQDAVDTAVMCLKVREHPLPTSQRPTNKQE